MNLEEKLGMAMRLPFGRFYLTDSCDGTTDQEANSMLHRNQRVSRKDARITIADWSTVDRDFHCAMSIYGNLIVYLNYWCKARATKDNRSK